MLNTSKKDMVKILNFGEKHVKSNKSKLLIAFVVDAQMVKVCLLEFL